MNVVVLISGSGSNLQALIDAAQSNSLGANISAVISNKADAYGLQRAQAADIPTQVLDHKAFPSREAFDAELAQVIEQYRPDLVVLAGFMRILTPGFTEQFNGRMLNIHPSLLPKYPGLHTHQRALEAGDTSHGATVHFVTPELDGGPNIIQAIVPVEASDSAETLAARVLLQEHIIYPKAVSWFAKGRLKMVDGCSVLDDSPLPVSGYQIDSRDS